MVEAPTEEENSLPFDLRHEPVESLSDVTGEETGGLGFMIEENSVGGAEF